MNDQDIIGIVSELNQEVFDTGLEDHSFFTFGTDGNNSWVEFAGCPIWEQYNDPRPWCPNAETGEEDWQEPLDLWLRKEARSIVVKLDTLTWEAR